MQVHILFLMNKYIHKKCITNDKELDIGYCCNLKQYTMQYCALVITYPSHNFVKWDSFGEYWQIILYWKYIYNVASHSAW